MISKNIRKTIKNVVTTTIIIGTITTVTACGKETVYVEKTVPKTTPKTTVPTQTLPPQTIPAWTNEDEYIYDIQTLYPQLPTNKQTLIETGHTVCDTLRQGVPLQQVIIILLQTSQGDTQIENYLITVTASAIANFCPEQQYQLG